MNFITLKELKKMVPVASEFKRVPGLKKILEDGIEVILRKQMENHAEVAFIFSISIEMLQLLLRLGTFQLSDIFYNTVGGVLGGLLYCVVMKARKRL